MVLNSLKSVPIEKRKHLLGIEQSLGYTSFRQIDLINDTWHQLTRSFLQASLSDKVKAIAAIYFRWGFLYTLNICLIFMFSVLLYYYGWGIKVFTTHSLHITGAKKGEREYVNWISDHFFAPPQCTHQNFLFLHMHMCGWRDKINSHPDRMDHLSNLYCLWLSDSFDLCSIVIIRWILVIMSSLAYQLRITRYFERSQSAMDGIK